MYLIHIEKVIDFVRCVLLHYEQQSISVSYVSVADTIGESISNMLTIADLKESDISGIVCSRDTLEAIELMTGVWYVKPSDILTLTECAECLI